MARIVKFMYAKKPIGINPDMVTTVMPERVDRAKPSCVIHVVGRGEYFVDGEFDAVCKKLQFGASIGTEGDEP